MTEFNEDWLFIRRVLKDLPENDLEIVRFEYERIEADRVEKIKNLVRRFES